MKERDHLGDLGRRWDVNINYLKEREWDDADYIYLAQGKDEW
jgi:hypothetical protein